MTIIINIIRMFTIFNLRYRTINLTKLILFMKQWIFLIYMRLFILICKKRIKWVHVLIIIIILIFSIFFLV